MSGLYEDGFVAEENWTDEQDAAAMKEFLEEREKVAAEAEHVEAVNEKSFARGIQGVFERRMELQEDLWKRRDEICDQYVEEMERMPEDLAEKRQELRLAKIEDMHWAPGVPLWMRISGLHPHSHQEMGPNERAGPSACCCGAWNGWQGGH